MGSVVLWLAGVIAMFSAGVRLQRAQQRTPGVVYLCLAVATVGCSAAMAAPLTLELLISVEPFGNFSRWLANGLAMVAAWSVHSLLLHLVHPPERARPSVRRQCVVLVAAVGAMTLLLLSAKLPSEPDFVAASGDHWQVTVYVSVFCGYVAYSLASFTRLMPYYARQSTRPWLRRGLGVARTGTSIGLVWDVLKILAAVTVLAGYRADWETWLSAVLSASCVALVGIGVTMPAWGPAIAAPARWLRRYRTQRALRPLWSALCTSFPEISRTLPAQPTSIDWRLTRRVIEIEDGLLLLAPYRARTGNPPPASDSEAAREAVEIRDALHRAQRGTRSGVGEAPTTRPRHETSDLEAEAAWLRRVARSYRCLPADDNPEILDKETRDQR